ncbi:hypothetical protein NP233_g3889 [Leucocoprinus birnbaumii]|uniref:G domain-containing protein n=1 Tax=Leucocoprinus birnbaumii TaxID=56174 RepID=A0AAD5W2B4_9AGAR|nr:hypothetical protein NP233_g3889 [Leucocoprinus birnbaumii]
MQLPEPQTPHNVVLFGAAGAGKSSVVNMLSPDQPVAGVSDGFERGTLQSQSYPIDVHGLQVTLWDTQGLEEKEDSRVPDVHAVVKLYKLLLDLDRQGGISLLVFVMRAPKINIATPADWKFFRNIICQGKVPTVIIITCLEAEEDRDLWWIEHKDQFEKEGIKLAEVSGCACITAHPGKKKKNGYTYQEEYDESRRDVLELIRKTILHEPIPVEPIKWFTNIFEKVKAWMPRHPLALRIINFFRKDSEALKKLRQLPNFDDGYVERLLQEMEGLEKDQVRTIRLTMKEIYLSVSFNSCFSDDN